MQGMNSSKESDVLVKVIADRREEFKKKHGYSNTEATRAIAKIPRYDWTRDPKGYRKEHPQGRIPDDRCLHCGSKFLHIKPWDAFCGPCHVAMMTGGEENLLGYVSKEKLKSKIRIPDNVEENVYLKHLEDGSKIEFKIGTQV